MPASCHSAAIAANPSTPAPRARRIRNVSATSSRVCAKATAPRPCRGGPGGQNGPPAAPCRILQIASAIPMPAQHLMAQPKRRTQAPDLGRLDRRFGAQAVVHRRDPNGQPGLHRQMQHRQTVTAPRNGKAQNLPVPGHPCHFRAKPRRKVAGQEQPSPCIAATAFASSALPGNRLPTSARVTQASGVWPSLPSDCPSLVSACPANSPSGAPEKASR